MQTHFDAPRTIELVNYEPDNLLLVEDWGDRVLIRAARDNFSERRKAYFVRHVAAEGFIPGHYELFAEFSEFGSGISVQWQIDQSWVAIDPATSGRTNRFMGRVLLYGLLLWLTTIIAVLVAGLP